MDLKIEIEKLKEYYHGSDMDKFQKQYLSVCENFPSQKEQIDNCMAGAIDESVLRTDDFIKETRIKAQLLEISNIVSLSYIAKKYFQKTRTWLYQKINGNKVNGKPACFTSEEIETFNLALQEISKKIGSTVVSL